MKSLHSRNKYGAQRTDYNGRTYDSKFEASIAQELDIRLKAGDIKAVQPQYKIEIICHNKSGNSAIRFTHKIDFCITHLDDTFELIEAKGVETTDYRWRRKLLENLWLPEHPNFIYTVVKQKGEINGRKW